MKRYKNISIKLATVYIAASVIAFAGCKKSFLNVPPQGVAPATNFFQTSDDATRAVYAIYANLRGYNEVAFSPIALESLGSDDAETGSDPSDGSVPAMNSYNNFTVTSTEGQIAGFWGGKYAQINLSNQVIDNVPN